MLRSAKTLGKGYVLLGGLLERKGKHSINERLCRHFLWTAGIGLEMTYFH